jgi:hypothetical protein
VKVDSRYGLVRDPLIAAVVMLERRVEGLAALVAAEQLRLRLPDRPPVQPEMFLEFSGRREESATAAFLAAWHLFP